MDFRFASHIIDTELPPGMYAQTALADLDGDGRLEFITGQRGGTIFWYKFHAPDRWSRHILGIPGGKIWWMENVNGEGTAWQRHEVDGGFTEVDGEKFRRGAYHSLFVGDLDGDRDFDLLSCEMEAVGGQQPPRWYIWENLDGKGGAWKEHTILDANLGGHEAVVGDVTGNGKPDVISKPWRAQPGNAVGGKTYVVFLENLSS